MFPILLQNFASVKTNTAMKNNQITKLVFLENILLTISIALSLFHIKGPWGVLLGFSFILFNFWYFFWETKNPQPEFDFMEKDNFPIILGALAGPVAALFLLEGETRDTALPFMALIFFLGLVWAALWYIKGDFKGKSISRIIFDSLHLSPVINLFLIFFCVYDIETGTIAPGIWRYVLAGVFTLDLVRGLVRLPKDIAEAKAVSEEFYRSLKEEKEELDKAASKVDVIDPGVKDLLDERIALIDKILIDKMSGTSMSGKAIAKEIENMTADRDSFIRSLGLLYSVNHPQAIRKLKEYELTEEEIGLCCLYYLGYSGKEVKEISRSSMIYHMNSTIRQKIGLKSNEMNLSTYMKQLFGNRIQ